MLKVLPRLKNSHCMMSVLVSFTLYRQAMNILTRISASGRKYLISTHALGSERCVLQRSLRQLTCMAACNNVDYFLGSFLLLHLWMDGWFVGGRWHRSSTEACFPAPRLLLLHTLWQPASSLWRTRLAASSIRHMKRLLMEGETRETGEGRTRKTGYKMLLTF